MSTALMTAVMTAEWTAAQAIIGAPFPAEWRGDGWGWLAPRVDEAERTPSAVAWGTRLAHMIDAPEGQPETVIAEVGFHGPPDKDSWVEIGYRVVVARRRQGFAHEAATRLIAWALDQGVRGVRASVSADNVPSRTLLADLDFAEVGAYRHDVLGEQLSYARPSERPAR